MNIKEYISNGIVESYVLGLASEPERQEFEAACRQYPEVLEARLQFEQQLEHTLLTEAVPPPVALKGRIQDAVINEPATTVVDMEAIEKRGAVRNMAIWKLMAAACLVLLIGTLIWAISLNNKYQALQARQKTLQQQAAESQQQLAQLEADAQKMQDPSVKMVALQGTAQAPGALATVFWDTTSKDVYMMINNLPQPASDKQYQLWAIIDNQPVDLGVFVRQERLLVRMKGAQRAQAFAVTLEPKGGSATPTLENMYVMGKL